MNAQARAQIAALPLDERIRLVSGADAWHTCAHPGLGLRSLRLSDGPHGLRVPTDDERDSLPATCFPTAVTLGQTWDRDLMADLGAALAVEARAQGVDVVLGPGLNLKRHPFGGRNFEYFSEDPLVSGELAAALVRGLQGGGVGACVKHFAVNSQETLRLCVDAEVDERTLHELYLSGFERVVRGARPWALMCSYNQVNGTAASTHHELLTEVLRRRWGFDGLVMSDWGAVWDPVASLEAGLDLRMPGGRDLMAPAVRAAVRSGRLHEDAVDEAVGHLVGLAGRVPESEAGEVPVGEHHDLAARIAAAGTVLASNDGVLPLAEGLTVAVIGGFATHPRFQGAGSSQVHPTRVTGLLDALKQRGVTTLHARGYDPESAGEDTDLLAEAIEVATRADVAIVMVGLPEDRESEGYDRTEFALPAQHDALVRGVSAANPRTVVAVVSGSPVALPWADRVAAVLLTGLGGQASGAGLADVLVGRADPGGRLAETWPRQVGDVASDPWFAGPGHVAEHREGLAVGYRHHVTHDVDPAFCFGHGLSYATTQWSDPQVSADRVEAGELAAGSGPTASITVANTSRRDGVEVVQVYLHDDSSVVCRPRRWLAGFTKVTVPAGASRRVEVALDPLAMGHWDTDRHDWAWANGRLQVQFARSSQEVVATTGIEVVGGVERAPQPARTPLVAADEDDFVARLGRPVPHRPAGVIDAQTTLGEAAQVPLGAALHAVVRRRAVHGITDARWRRMIEHTVDEMPLRQLPSMAQLPPELVDVVVAALNGPEVLVRLGARALWGSAPLAGLRRWWAERQTAG